MWVVACTPLRLKAFAVSASIAARTTGAYSGLQPAITILIASTSRVRPPYRGGTLHSTRSGVAAQRLDDSVDLRAGRRHHRQPVGPSLLEIPFDEARARWDP